MDADTAPVLRRVAVLNLYIQDPASGRVGGGGVTGWGVVGGKGGGRGRQCTRRRRRVAGGGVGGAMVAGGEGGHGVQQLWWTLHAIMASAGGLPGGPVAAALLSSLHNTCRRIVGAQL